MIQRAFPLDIEIFFFMLYIKRGLSSEEFKCCGLCLYGLFAVFCHHFRCQFLCIQAQSCRKTFRQHQVHKQDVNIKKALFYYYLENRVLVVEERRLMTGAGVEQRHLHVPGEFGHLCFVFILFSKCSYSLKKIISSQEERVKLVIIVALQLSEYTFQKITFKFLPVLL